MGDAKKWRSRRNRGENNSAFRFKCVLSSSQISTTEQGHTENAKCGVTGVQHCGVVADFTLVHPLQVETGSEDGQ